MKRCPHKKAFFSINADNFRTERLDIYFVIRLFILHLGALYNKKCPIRETGLSKVDIKKKSFLCSQVTFSMENFKLLFHSTKKWKQLKILTSPEKLIPAALIC